MAAAARTVRMAPRLAALGRPAITRSVPSVAQRAAFSVSVGRFKSEVIKETEVPVSVYSPDSKGTASASSDHFTIPVKNNSRPLEPAPEEEEVVPLQDKVYSQMPRTLQKMSVHGKVIIITG